MGRIGSKLRAEERVERAGERVTYATVSALIILIESTHAQGADVTCPMVAGGDSLMDDGAGAYEADLGLEVIVIVGAINSRSSSGGGGSSTQLGLSRDVGGLR